jgi:hypothetical protein
VAEDAARALVDDAENDVLAFMTFPRAHWTQIYSTNPLERLNAEIKRRTNVVGIFPNDASITRLVGAMMLEQNDEWSLNRRYMQFEGLQTLSDTAPTRLPAVARCVPCISAFSGLWTYTTEWDATARRVSTRQQPHRRDDAHTSHAGSDCAAVGLEGALL